MIISNLPINDDIAKKLIYKNDGGTSVEISAKDVATTNYVDEQIEELNADFTMVTDNLMNEIVGITENMGDRFEVVEDFLGIALPNGYTQLGYVAGTGTQYIDTGITLTQDSKVEMLISHFDSSKNSKVFGSRSSANANNFSIVSGPVSGKMSIVCDFYNYNYNRVVHALEDNQTFEFSINKEKLKINDIEHTVTNYSDFTAPNTAYLFSASGSYPQGYVNATMWLHYCKIYNNEVLIRDFKPCINPDGEIGLYDLVTEMFYGNVGSGVFEGDIGEEDSLQNRINAVKDYVDVVVDEAIGTKANASDLTSHTDNTTVHITADERTAWNAKASVEYVDTLVGDITTLINNL